LFVLLILDKLLTNTV